MNNKKMFFSVFMTIVIIISSVSVAFVAKAEDYIARYTGSTQSNGMNISCTFQINEIADNRFRGVFSDSGTGIYDFSENIEGNYYRSGDKITCIFHVSFYNIMIDRSKDRFLLLWFCGSNSTQCWLRCSCFSYLVIPCTRTTNEHHS